MRPADEPAIPWELPPLKDQAACDAALREIEQLWNAPEGSDAWARCLALCLVVDQYEREHHPIHDPSPECVAAFHQELARLAGEP